MQSKHTYEPGKIDHLKGFQNRQVFKHQKKDYKFPSDLELFKIKHLNSLINNHVQGLQQIPEIIEFDDFFEMIEPLNSEMKEKIQIFVQELGLTSVDKIQEENLNQAFDLLNFKNDKHKPILTGWKLNNLAIYYIRMNNLREAESKLKIALKYMDSSSTKLFLNPFSNLGQTVIPEKLVNQMKLKQYSNRKQTQQLGLPQPSLKKIRGITFLNLGVINHINHDKAFEFLTYAVENLYEACIELQALAAAYKSDPSSSSNYLLAPQQQDIGQIIGNIQIFVFLPQYFTDPLSESLALLAIALYNLGYHEFQRNNPNNILRANECFQNSATILEQNFGSQNKLSQEINDYAFQFYNKNVQTLKNHQIQLQKNSNIEQRKFFTAGSLPSLELIRNRSSVLKTSENQSPYVHVNNHTMFQSYDLEFTRQNCTGCKIMPGNFQFQSQLNNNHNLKKGLISKSTKTLLRPSSSSVKFGTNNNGLQEQQLEQQQYINPDKQQNYYESQPIKKNLYKIKKVVETDKKEKFKIKEIHEIWINHQFGELKASYDPKTKFVIFELIKTDSKGILIVEVLDEINFQQVVEQHGNYAESPETQFLVNDFIDNIYTSIIESNKYEEEFLTFWVQEREYGKHEYKYFVTFFSGKKFIQNVLVKINQIHPYQLQNNSGEEEQEIGKSKFKNNHSNVINNQDQDNFQDDYNNILQNSLIIQMKDSVTEKIKISNENNLNNNTDDFNPNLDDKDYDQLKTEFNSISSKFQKYGKNHRFFFKDPEKKIIEKKIEVKLKCEICAIMQTQIKEMVQIRGHYDHKMQTLENQLKTANMDLDQIVKLELIIKTRNQELETWKGQFYKIEQQNNETILKFKNSEAELKKTKGLFQNLDQQNTENIGQIKKLTEQNADQTEQLVQVPVLKQKLELMQRELNKFKTFYEQTQKDKQDQKVHMNEIAKEKQLQFELQKKELQIEIEKQNEKNVYMQTTMQELQQSVFDLEAQLQALNQKSEKEKKELEDIVASKDSEISQQQSQISIIEGLLNSAAHEKEMEEITNKYEDIILKMREELQQKTKEFTTKEATTLLQFKESEKKLQHDLDEITGKFNFKDNELQCLVEKNEQDFQAHQEEIGSLKAQIQNLKQNLIDGGLMDEKEIEGEEKRQEGQKDKLNQITEQYKILEAQMKICVHKIQLEDNFKQILAAQTQNKFKFQQKSTQQPEIKIHFESLQIKITLLLQQFEKEQHEDQEQQIQQLQNELKQVQSQLDLLDKEISTLNTNIQQNSEDHVKILTQIDIITIEYYKIQYLQNQQQSSEDSKEKSRSFLTQEADQKVILDYQQKIAQLNADIYQQQEKQEKLQNQINHQNQQIQDLEKFRQQNSISQTHNINNTESQAHLHIQSELDRQLTLNQELQIIITQKEQQILTFQQTIGTKQNLDSNNDLIENQIQIEQFKAHLAEKNTLANEQYLQIQALQLQLADQQNSIEQSKQNLSKLQSQDQIDTNINNNTNQSLFQQFKQEVNQIQSSEEQEQTFLQIELLRQDIELLNLKISDQQIIINEKDRLIQQYKQQNAIEQSKQNLSKLQSQDQIDININNNTNQSLIQQFKQEVNQIQSSEEQQQTSLQIELLRQDIELLNLKIQDQYIIINEKDCLIQQYEQHKNSYLKENQQQKQEINKIDSSQEQHKLLKNDMQTLHLKISQLEKFNSEKDLEIQHLKHSKNEQEIQVKAFKYQQEENQIQIVHTKNQIFQETQQINQNFEENYQQNNQIFEINTNNNKEIHVQTSSNQSQQHQQDISYQFETHITTSTNYHENHIQTNSHQQIEYVQIQQIHQQQSEEPQ